MQKGYRTLSLISILVLGLWSTVGRAQSLTYELMGRYSSSADTPDTIRLTPHLPAGFVFCSFDFDVIPDEVLVPDEVFIFTTPANDTINVTLYYTTTGGDCSGSDPNRTSVVIPICPKRALFNVTYDKELQSLASLKRVFRSVPYIASNNFSQIGNFRYFWDFDIKMIPVPEVDFDPADASKGQFPNVYYTFATGGVYQTTLSVIDISSNLDTAKFTRIFNLHPVFGDNLIDLENVPNVFTPGGATNNFFKVETSGVNQFSFKVFTRSGALVYQHTGNIISWDGKNYYGNDLPAGIYYYIIEDISPEKKYNPAKGFFYIYR